MAALEPSYEPTPGEIALACAEIQRNWSPQEREQRSRFFADGNRRVRAPYTPRHWSPPLVAAALLDELT